MLARTNIKVFYQSHQTILNKNMTSKIINDKVGLIATNFPELNGKELKVIELILQEFSSNEIAVMLEKSQKNIEFTKKLMIFCKPKNWRCWIFGDTVGKWEPTKKNGTKPKNSLNY